MHPDQSSTGHLGDEEFRSALAEIYAAALNHTEGSNSSLYPALSAADPEQFGLSLALGDGRVFEAGDAAAGFALMSAAKPFGFALACAHLGVEQAGRQIGVNATASEFNDIGPVLTLPGGRTNPMVNAGAIATCSRLPGKDVEARWRFLRAGLSAFAGRPLAVDEALYAGVTATNTRNRELAAALEARGALACAASDALELYSRQSCLLVTARDLAVMGATLAHGGVNPVTGESVVPDAVCAPTLAVMVTAGMYEHSGEWLYSVGLPGKSGIGGGIVTVAPGVGALGSFSPRLDTAGNSVRGVQAATLLARTLGLSLFSPAVQTVGSAVRQR